MTTSEPGPQGGLLVTISYVLTAVLLVACVVAVLGGDRDEEALAWISGGLFTIGLLGFLVAFVLGIGRSRDEVVSLGGLFFLTSDAAPKLVALRLRLVLAVQIVAAVTAASIRPFTTVAFVILAPMAGLGIMGLWSARHGRFPVREPR